MVKGYSMPAKTKWCISCATPDPEKRRNPLWKQGKTCFDIEASWIGHGCVPILNVVARSFGNVFHCLSSFALDVSRDPRFAHGFPHRLIGGTRLLSCFRTCSKLCVAVSGTFKTCDGSALVRNNTHVPITANEEDDDQHEKD